jgi:hypothetical protein
MNLLRLRPDHKWRWGWGIVIGAMEIVGIFGSKPSGIAITFMRPLRSEK